MALFSICDNPSEIDVREVKTKLNWAYSDSFLITQSSDKTCKPWKIGISKNGYENYELRYFC